MGLQKVKQEIINESRKKAELIKKQAEDEATKISAEIEAKIKALAEKTENETKKLSEEIKKRELSAVKLEGKKFMLSIKKQVVDKAFEEAIKALKNQSGPDRQKILSKLVKKAAGQLEIARVYCQKAHIPDVEAVLKEEGLTAQVSEKDIVGGIIAENSSGTVSVDYSYESLIQSLRESLLSEVASLIFGEKNAKKKAKA